MLTFNDYNAVEKADALPGHSIYRGCLKAVNLKSGGRPLYGKVGYGPGIARLGSFEEDPVVVEKLTNGTVVFGTPNPQRIIDASAGSDLGLTRGEWYGLIQAAGRHVP